MERNTKDASQDASQGEHVDGVCLVISTGQNPTEDLLINQAVLNTGPKKGRHVQTGSELAAW